MAEESAPFVIGDRRIAAGTRENVDLPVSVLADHTPVALSVHVVHGRRPGPSMFVSAAVHGDEVIGVEIVRRLLRTPALNRLRGTLMAVPVVNSFGFMNHSRYLPDRRDLNRSFPGSATGSLAARLAHLMTTQIVLRSQLGIDLHSAAIHRSNLPQIRVAPSAERGLELARVFGPPLILSSPLREGSLRQTAKAHGIDVLTYEGGEGLRFDEFAVRAGVAGILRVMHHEGMLPARGIPRSRVRSLYARRSHWLRAPAGGLLRAFRAQGDHVETGTVLGVISDPFGEVEAEIVAEKPGIIAGRSNLPVVNEGDGLFHIAELKAVELVGETLERMTSQLDQEALFDEDEII